MNIQEFKNVLDNSNTKLNVFTDFELLDTIDFSKEELINLIREYMSSEEIIKLFNYSYYQELPETLRNEIIGFMQFPIDAAIWAFLELNDNGQKQLILNEAFVKKNFTMDTVACLCFKMDDNIKNMVLEFYSSERSLKLGIYEGYTDDKKKKILKEDDLTTDEKIKILFSLKDEDIGRFLQENNDFCNENNITPFELMKRLVNKKRNVVSNRSEVERSIDITDFPLEYRKCVDLGLQENMQYILIDLNSDLEKYRGLDRFIRISPQEFSEEKIKKLMQLCEICPNLQVLNRLGNNDNGPPLCISSGKEYKEAEEWIAHIIGKLKPEYLKSQKIAIIDHEIGRKISYSADFGTKNFKENDARCLWKIISSGYGVCNGIANVEQYIFNRIGVESEFINSGNHSFLKVIDVDLLLSNGELIVEDGIVDVTWNLAAHKFGGKPNNFFISYQEARKNDIDKDGKDFGCHYCDKKLKNLNYGLDDASLRQLFCSVGITNEDGTFPLQIFMNELENIDMECAR